MTSDLFLIKPLDGFSPQISQLISMMAYTRWTTLKAVEGISVSELDYLISPDSNSVAMLLEHFGAVETYYQIHTFEKREPEEDEMASWRAGSELGERGRKEIKGHELAYYLDRLKAVRQTTLDEFAKRNDDWLFEETDWWIGQKSNTYFKWFHVFEDELNHRGQIRLIRKHYQSAS